MAPAKRTTQRKTEEDPSGVLTDPTRPKPILLLHVCCGPCSTHVVDLLKSTYHLIGFFYNPNLYPEEEFNKRLEATARVFREGLCVLWVLPFDPAPWMEIVRGLGGEPEGGKRCEICIRHRLEVTARVAEAASVGSFGTTLSVSPRKRSLLINKIGIELSRTHGSSFYVADFKKKDGFLKSVQKSRHLGLYRQDYCGCCFTMRRPSPGQPPPPDRNRRTFR